MDKKAAFSNEILNALLFIILKHNLLAIIKRK
jgi:hypothetical protein